MRRWLVVPLLLIFAIPMMGNERPPWHARRRPHPRPNRLAQARVAIADWPDEPRTPDHIDPPRFARAIRTICGWMPPGRATRYAGWILESAQTFDIDPFLVAALVYREGRCRYDADGGDRGSGTGLTLIDTRMYWDNIRGRSGVLRYRIRENDAWLQRERTVDRFPFNGPRLRVPESNIYFAAALLAMWKDQHETLDETFENEPHRHFVSHFIWGDRVRSDRQEDRILTERRRLLEYYGEPESAPPIVWGGITFGCPLNGCPRVITSYIGSPRDAGSRHHRGVDLESLPGEQVRAISGGLVVFAGVDLPGGQNNRQLRVTSQYDAIPRDQLGAGGRYVCVRHRREGDLPNARSCYMHLERVNVSYGDTVERGAVLGTVGRTGMRRSAAHLHLELHTDHVEDPSEILYGLLLGQRVSDPHPRRR